MHDFVVPLRRRLLRHRGAPVVEYYSDLAAKALLVESECFLALPIETKIRIQLHNALPCVKKYDSSPLVIFSFAPAEAMVRDRTEPCRFPPRTARKSVHAQPSIFHLACGSR